MMLMVSEKGIVELDVEEGTMKFAGRKVGTLKSSKSKDRNGTGSSYPVPVPGSNPCRGALFLPIPVNKKISISRHVFRLKNRNTSPLKQTKDGLHENKSPSKRENFLIYPVYHRIQAIKFIKS